MHLVLASRSPRRRELLAAAGIACQIDPVNVDERVLPREAPEAYVVRIAETKAAAGAARHPHAVVLGADTIVVLDDRILGKPADEDDALAMLRALRGRAHLVLTGVAVAWRGEVRTRLEETRVWMADVTDAELQAYVRSGEPLDKAGAYGIQGLASRFIPRIDGSYANVVGLPVSTVAEILADLGLGAAGPAPDSR